MHGAPHGALQGSSVDLILAAMTLVAFTPPVTPSMLRSIVYLDASQYCSMRA